MPTGPYKISLEPQSRRRQSVTSGIVDTLCYRRCLFRLKKPLIIVGETWKIFPKIFRYDTVGLFLTQVNLKSVFEKQSEK